MRVAVLSPTTSQLVEKMAALFPEGVDLVGPQADDRHYWNNCHLRLDGWKELGLNVRIIERPFDSVDFHNYDLLIESAETFSYAKDWAKYSSKLDCPIILKACWANQPKGVLPPEYIKKVRDFPLLLEMPAHAGNWKAAGFRDVNVVPNPVGDWWFQGNWTGEKEQVLFVLSGKDAWRPGDATLTGFDLWQRLCDRFPGRTYHHDGHKNGYKTPREMAKLFSESRVFANFDRPYGCGERPLTLSFTEALSAGLPVVARDLPGLNYKQYIDSNGACSEDFDVICRFVEKCFRDIEYAGKCGLRSRDIARVAFSFDSLRPRYAQIIARAQSTFAERERKRRRSFAYFTSWLPSRGLNGHKAANVFDQLAELYEKRCPPGYAIDKQIKSFYSDESYWEKFRMWEKTRESYSIRDKEFVESVFKVDGADIVNIGCFYPWAEIEWGGRARQWTALDINKDVLDRARRALVEYRDHNISFAEQDVTVPFYLGRRVDCVLDLSTGDQLDPRKLWNVLCNYMRLSDRLLMAYDATNEPLAVFDFQNYGFNALYNPKTISDVLTLAGYRVTEHRPFSYHNRSYVAAALSASTGSNDSADTLALEHAGS